MQSFRTSLRGMAAEKLSRRIGSHVVLVERAFGLLVEVGENIATLFEAPFDASSRATTAFQVAVHLL